MKMRVVRWDSNGSVKTGSVYDCAKDLGLSADQVRTRASGDTQTNEHGIRYIDKKVERKGKVLWGETIEDIIYNLVDGYNQECSRLSCVGCSFESETYRFNTNCVVRQMAYLILKSQGGGMSKKDAVDIVERRRNRGK